MASIDPRKQHTCGETIFGCWKKGIPNWFHSLAQKQVKTEIIKDKDIGQAIFLIKAKLFFGPILYWIFTQKFMDKFKQFHVIQRFVIQENAESELRAHSSSVRQSAVMDKVPEASMPKVDKLKTFIKEEALVGIYNVCIPFSFCLHEFSYHLNFLVYN